MKMKKKILNYLCTYDLYGPVRNAFDAEQHPLRGQVRGGWALEKSRVFWAL
jgi:hypothetical protein